jgi:hypothetical protein
MKRAPDFPPWRSFPILKAPDPRLRAISRPVKMNEWPLLNRLPGPLVALGGTGTRTDVFRNLYGLISNSVPQPERSRIPGAQFAN